MQISEVYSADDRCIWMSIKYFVENPTPVKEVTYKNVFGQVITPENFSNERSMIMNAPLTTTRGRVAYNIMCGIMIVAIFREEVIDGTVRGKGLTILSAFSSIELALLAGALSEAMDLIARIEISDWWTEDMRIRYLSMCESADAIIYRSDDAG